MSAHEEVINKSRRKALIHAIALNKSLDSPVTYETLRDGTLLLLGNFEDEFWPLPDSDFPPGTPNHKKILNFKSTPPNFTLFAKAIILSYITFGIEGLKRPSGSTIIAFNLQLNTFLNYIFQYITNYNQITPALCMQFAAHIKSTKTRSGKPFSKNYINVLCRAVEKTQKIAASLFIPMEHPWSDSSAGSLSGVDGHYSRHSKTLPIPDDTLKTIFQDCEDKINNSAETVSAINKVKDLKEKYSYSGTINTHLAQSGYKVKVIDINNQKSQLIDACILIVLLTSGIRIKELASLEAGCYYIRRDEDGNTQYWMKGLSTKTNVGMTDWLVTKITHDALKLAESLTKEMRADLKAYYDRIKDIPEKFKEADKILRHLNSIFMGKGSREHRYETLTDQSLRSRVKAYSKNLKLNWNLHPHQFRRTFARYVARSSLGDIRYLREHFKHWALDMTIMYSEDQVRDEELHDEIYVSIRNEKLLIVESLFEEKTLIAGGLSDPIRRMRSSTEVVRTYGSRADMIKSVSESIHLRSTGIAWCTHLARDCSGGHALDRTRCGGCDRSIIDKTREPYWRAIYIQMLELFDIADSCGHAAKLRVEIDLKMCEHVLTQLGADINPIKQSLL